jgi:dUTP pyrophosphatase
MVDIKIKYHNNDMTKIDKSSKGNFIDLRSSEKVELKAGDFKMIDLGVSIKLPEGYWGQVVPRSSLFKNHGLIQTNSFGVIDTTYCGEDDHWKLPVYATRDTIVEFDERICQFRIVKDNDFEIKEVEMMTDTSRGGFGSTGRL